MLGAVRLRGKPLPPPRRSAAAVASPPTKPGAQRHDRRHGWRDDQRVALGAALATPSPGVRRPSRASRATAAAKLGKDGAKPDDSGRARRSGPTPILKAKSLDAPDDDDANSVLFGPTGINTDPIHLMDIRAKSKKPPPPIPKWYLYGIGGGLLLAIIIVVLAIGVRRAVGLEKVGASAAQPDQHHSKLLDK